MQRLQGLVSPSGAIQVDVSVGALASLCDRSIGAQPMCRRCCKQLSSPAPSFRRALGVVSPGSETVQYMGAGGTLRYLFQACPLPSSERATLRLRGQRPNPYAQFPAQRAVARGRNPGSDICRQQTWCKHRRRQARLMQQGVRSLLRRPDCCRSESATLPRRCTQRATDRVVTQSFSWLTDSTAKVEAKTLQGTL